MASSLVFGERVIGESKGRKVTLVGKQTAGRSSEPIYNMAISCIHEWALAEASLIIDIGGGAGGFARHLLRENYDVCIVDHEIGVSSSEIKYEERDLNHEWDLGINIYDAAIALEVIEHIESPRHFMRQVFKLIKPGGYCFITTPNNLSIVSKLCLVIRGQFRAFQKRGGSYPAHITSLVKEDMLNISDEIGYRFIKFVYSNNGRIPFTRINWQIFPFLRGSNFSDNLGMVLRKPEN